MILIHFNRILMHLAHTIHIKEKGVVDIYIISKSANLKLGLQNYEFL